MTTLSPGQSLTTPGRTIGAGDINLFAGLVGDFTPIHVDEVFAKASPFGTRIAHGPLAMATAIAVIALTCAVGIGTTEAHAFGGEGFRGGGFHGGFGGFRGGFGRDGRFGRGFYGFGFAPN